MIINIIEDIIIINFLCFLKKDLFLNTLISIILLVISLSLLLLLFKVSSVSYLS